MTAPSDPADDLPLAELRRVVATLVSEVGRLQGQAVELRAIVAAKDAQISELKAEIARLKGLPPRPKFTGKPSGMEQATGKGAGKKGRKPGRGAKRCKLAITAEVVVGAQVPPGSRFKGYEDVLVQDLRIRVAVVRYRRERWLTPSGERVVAAMPAGVMESSQLPCPSARAIQMSPRAVVER